eukprot:1453528-Pyramimonas_sp.AAC.1
MRSTFSVSSCPFLISSSSALIDWSTGDLSPSYGPGKKQRHSAMLHYAMECDDTPYYEMKRNVTIQYAMQ